MTAILSTCRGRLVLVKHYPGLLLSDVPSDIAHGDPAAADQLLPLVYDELRKLAASKLTDEAPGQTLQATALVHEAYVRLVGDKPAGGWAGKT